jgi:hypothetical protein
MRFAYLFSFKNLGARTNTWNNKLKERQSGKSFLNARFSSTIAKPYPNIESAYGVRTQYLNIL